MSKGEYIVITFILFLLVSLTVAVLETATEIREIVQERELSIDRSHLPSECEKYYNDGTDRWKDCMGVGYVKIP